MSFVSTHPVIFASGPQRCCLTFDNRPELVVDPIPVANYDQSSGFYRIFRDLFQTPSKYTLKLTNSEWPILTDAGIPEKCRKFGIVTTITPDQLRMKFTFAACMTSDEFYAIDQLAFTQNIGLQQEDFNSMAFSMLPASVIESAPNVRYLTYYVSCNCTVDIDGTLPTKYNGILHRFHNGIMLSNNMIDSGIREFALPHFSPQICESLIDEVCNPATPIGHLVTIFSSPYNEPATWRQLHFIDFEVETI